MQRIEDSSRLYGSKVSDANSESLNIPSDKFSILNTHVQQSISASGNYNNQFIN